MYHQGEKKDAEGGDPVSFFVDPPIPQTPEQGDGKQDQRMKDEKHHPIILLEYRPR